MILTVTQLQTLRPTLRGKIVATNGCFDLLHAGHVHYLDEARRKGVILIVGLNSDASIRELKGKSRPIIPQHERAQVLQGLRSVDHVCIFEGVRCVDFLLACKPDVYVKGGDYNLETLDLGERKALGGAKIVFVPIVTKLSTSEVIHRVADTVTL